MRGVTRRAARGIGVLAVIGSGFWGVGAAQADDFTIGGAFNDLNDVVLIEFSHPGGAFTAFTSQWPGATVDGFPAPPAADPFLNGFDAQLQLFIGTGPAATFDTANDDAGILFSANVGGTTFTGGLVDSLLDLASLTAGDYTLGLTAFNNDPLAQFDPALTLGDGYDDNGTPISFTGPQFRVHLQGIDQILSVDAPNPVSISGPFNGGMTM